MSEYFAGSLLGIPVLSFIFAGAGAYLASYLGKKGEHLATKEDFNDLKSQTAALTQAAKEIEARISDQVWDRQAAMGIKKRYFARCDKTPLRCS